MYISSTGAIRKNNGKPEMSQLDPRFIMEMAKLLTNMDKCGKYDKYNWTKGMELSKTLDSLERHLYAFKVGINEDDESKFNHLVHVAVNAMFAWNTYKLDNPELDDRHFKGEEK